MNRRIRIVTFLGAITLYVMMITRGIAREDEMEIWNGIMLILLATGLIISMENMRRKRHHVFLSKTEEDVSKMTKQELVAYVGELFKRMQYNVPPIKEEKKDADLFVRKGVKKAFCIECIVGDRIESDVIEAFAHQTSKYKKLDKILITNGLTTSGEMKYASDRAVRLIDRAHLLRIAKRMEL